MAQQGASRTRGQRRLEVARHVFAGDLDLDRTLVRTDGRPPTSADDIVSRRWTSSQRAICLLVDHSGSMTGPGLARAAMAAASVLVAAGERADCSVIAFAKDAVVLQQQGRRRPHTALLDDVLSLRGRGVTDVALALRAARRELGRSSARERAVVLLSDAKSTTGADPLSALSGIETVHVLGTSDDAESVEAGSRLARRGGGRYRTCTSLLDVPHALGVLLN